MAIDETTPEFYHHEQLAALQAFLPVLHPHLPHSNGIYNRLQAPHNTPSRHCVFAATFPPPSPGSLPSIPEIYTILFADRSRHHESHIWLFNPLITHSNPLSQADQDILTSHLTSSIYFLKNLSIPSAPGWPFLPLLRFACIHASLLPSFQSITGPRDAMPYLTTWNHFIISTTSLLSHPPKSTPLQEGFTVSRVPEDQLPVVISTSSIPRQPSTYLLLPSVGVLNPEGTLVAWGYIGIDSSFSTLYVVPGYRGRGLARYVAEQLLVRLARGEFRDRKSVV